VATPTILDAAFFERLFAGAGLAVFACDPGGRILAWNPVGARLFEGCQRQPQDADLRDVLPREDRPVFDDNLRTLLRTRQPLEFRTRISGKAGQPTEYAVWLTPILDPRDALEGVCVWFNDITARLQLRRSLRKRERLAALGALAGAVAHHYNNLLCSIVTSLEFALNMNTLAAMRRVLRRTADAAGRATRLTQQLLAFAQADHRPGDLGDLTEVVLRYFDEHEEELKRAGIELRLDWEVIPAVAVPREQFNVILDNLAQNAIEAMPGGGRLDVCLRRHDQDKVILTITDAGPGIPPEHMEHLFEPFFTTKGELADGDTHRAGMGLAVVYGLVSEMHGTITAHNAPGGGTRFEIVLPIPRDP